MLHHRFQEQLQALSSIGPVMLVGACAFVSCPMFMAFSSSHQAQVLAIYQIAAQQTREQHAPPRRSRMAEFSVN